MRQILPIVLSMSLWSCQDVDAALPQNVAMCKLAMVVRNPTIGWSCVNEVPIIPVCNWSNVACDANVNVTNIYFQDASYCKGPIPSELGLLQSLGTLSITTSSISKTLPSEIGNIASLSSLSLDGNQLTGKHYSKPSKSQTVTLVVSVGSIPSTLGRLTNLQALSLTRNAFSKQIPHELSNLQALVSLRLYNNQLTGPIISTIGNMTSLFKIDLAWNRLTGT